MRHQRTSVKPGGYQTSRNSSSIAPASAGRGFAWVPGRAATASASPPRFGPSGRRGRAGARSHPLYLFKQLFGDKLQASTVTSIEEGANTRLAAQLAAELGSPFEGSLNELEKADCVLVLGADLVEDHEVAGFFIKRNVPHGTQVISVGYAENGIAETADVVLQPNTEKYDELIQAITAALSDKPVAALAKAAGVDEAAVKEAAQILAAANFPAIVYGEALLKNASLTTLKALVELGHLSGTIGEQRNALISIKGKANSMAAAQYGLDQAMEISDEQAVFIALGDDCPSQKLIKRLEKAPFVAVQASYSSQLTAQADVVLPVTNWTEQEGSYLNVDGKLQLAVKSMTAPEEVLTNAVVFEKLAAALGVDLNAADWKDELLKQIPVAVIAE